MTRLANRPLRPDPDDLESVLWQYDRRAVTVALWRRRAPGDWVYLGRLSASLKDDEGFLEAVRLRYGGGKYRAKIYGAWNPKTRREPFLQQVTFAVWGVPR
jgi:hypothetical protein